MGHSYSSNNKVIDRLEHREFLGRNTLDAIEIYATFEKYADAMGPEKECLYSHIGLTFGGNTRHTVIVAKDDGYGRQANLDYLDTMISVLTKLRKFIRKHS